MCVFQLKPPHEIILSCFTELVVPLNRWTWCLEYQMRLAIFLTWESSLSCHFSLENSSVPSTTVCLISFVYTISFVLLFLWQPSNLISINTLATVSLYCYNLYRCICTHLYKLFIFLVLIKSVYVCNVWDLVYWTLRFSSFFFFKSILKSNPAWQSLDQLSRKPTIVSLLSLCTKVDAHF